MSMAHRTLLFCGALVASLASGCAPGVESSGAPAAVSKQPVEGSSDQEKGDPAPTPAECVQGTLDDYACVDLGSDEKYPIAGGITAVTAECDKLGFLVSSMSTSADDCGPQSGKVAYVCCPPPPPSGPTPGSCHEEKVWSGACEELASLETKGTALCAESGDVLTATISLGGCSGTQSVGLEITCCPPAP